MASIPIKYISSAQLDAPVLNGVAGSLKSVLDACLDTGFGARAVDSLVVVGGVATVTVSAGHCALPHTVQRVGGITGPLAALNGDQRVLTTTTTTYTFATAMGDGTAIGSVTTRVAPLGWLRPFSAGNVAAYRSAVPEATGCYFRLDDTSTTTARVVGYESMSDINTGTGRFPTEAVQAGGYHWPKSSSASAAARQWMVIGDDRFFAILLSANNYGPLYGAGDFVPRRSGDPYAFLLCGATSAVVAGTSGIYGSLGATQSSESTVITVPRSYTGLGESVALRQASAFSTRNGYSGLDTTSPALPFPSGPANELFLSDLRLFESGHLRGRVPGVYHTPQLAHVSYSSGGTFPGEGDFAGRQMLAMTPGDTTGTNKGVVFVDLTGPWRD